MKLQFKRQGYQTDAVMSVVDCFAGQPKSTGIQYRIDPGREEARPLIRPGMVDELGGFKNSDLAIPQQQLFQNIQAVQQRQNHPLSSSLVSTKVCPINLDIEMETGTGKTYCYIKTMFELHEVTVHGPV